MSNFPPTGSGQDEKNRMTKPADTDAIPKFAIFRRDDAPAFGETEVMHYGELTEEQKQGSALVSEAGLMEGNRLQLLFAIPGMSLAYAWFKSGFPLPRHSHSADCLYYIIGGSLRMGDQELKAGDGFFIGTDVPYSYVPGDEGVEVLEFRTSSHFDIKLLVNNPAYWVKAAEKIRERLPAWKEEKVSPSGIMRDA